MHFASLITRFLNPSGTAWLCSLFLTAILGTAVSAQDKTMETVTDIDGHVYATVQIGDQVWLAENLRTTRYSDGSPVEHFAVNNDDTQVEAYGLLYRWEAALRFPAPADSVTGHVQGASPDGWHIPSETEWAALARHLGDADAASEALTAAGFGIRYSGWYDFSGAFKGLGEKTFLRSATSPGGGGGYAREFNITETALKQVFLHPDDAIPIRCIKN